jgi:hypothetical protein
LLDHIGSVSEALRYLRSPEAQSESLFLGTFAEARVELRWDNEDSHRCFLVIGGVGKSGLHLTLCPEDTRALADALEEALADLDEPERVQK